MVRWNLFCCAEVLLIQPRTDIPEITYSFRQELGEPSGALDSPFELLAETVFFGPEGLIDVMKLFKQLTCLGFIGTVNNNFDRLKAAR